MTKKVFSEKTKEKAGVPKAKNLKKYMPRQGLLASGQPDLGIQGGLLYQPWTEKYQTEHGDPNLFGFTPPTVGGWTTRETTLPNWDEVNLARPETNGESTNNNNSSVDDGGPYGPDDTPISGGRGPGGPYQGWPGPGDEQYEALYPGATAAAQAAGVSVGDWVKAGIKTGALLGNPFLGGLGGLAKGILSGDYGKYKNQVKADMVRYGILNNVNQKYYSDDWKAYLAAKAGESSDGPAGTEGEGLGAGFTDADIGHEAAWAY